MFKEYTKNILNVIIIIFKSNFKNTFSKTLREF